ncbi:MAG: hypothetical protein AB7Q81_11885 [Gammaproteobacteria bacterium]
MSTLADALRTYFRHTEGRGKNCVVEPFRREEFDYFFCYPEDYSQQTIEWVGGEFARRPHNPAFEVIYVYSKQAGALDLNFRGSRKAIEPLQAMFATTLLKLSELPPDPKDARVYDLNPLRQRSFEFVFDTSSGVEDVRVNKLRLSSKVRPGERMTLESGTARNPEAVYELLAEVGRVLPLHLYNVTQVELSATVTRGAGEKPKSVVIRITHPNSCSLKCDEQDLKLRDMLRASGIEPREAAEGNGTETDAGESGAA